jgi:hypothetical protein
MYRQAVSPPARELSPRQSSTDALFFVDIATDGKLEVVKRAVIRNGKLLPRARPFFILKFIFTHGSSYTKCFKYARWARGAGQSRISLHLHLEKNETHLSQILVCHNH